MVGLEWINDLVQAVLSFIPRPLIVRSTHGGVKWKFGRKIRELKPGFHFWWPLVSETCLIVTARQTHNTATQGLMTLDREQVAVGGVLVYSIKDVVQAIGKRNWDVETTVNDITQAAIVSVITQWTLDDLLSEICGDVEKQLTRRCRKELRQYGVYVHRAALTDFSICKAYNVLSSGCPTVVPTEEEDE